MNRAPGLRVALPPALVVLVIGSIGIGSRSLWSDELATWYAATISFDDLHRLLAGTDAVLAPYYVGMHGWIDLSGDSPAALRLPSLVAMATAAAIVALVGRRLGGDRVGLVAGLVFAVVPSTSRYAQEARPYALAVMFAALATLLLLRACESPTWRRWLLYALAVAAAGTMHIVTLTVLVAHAAYVLGGLLRDGDRDRRLVRWIPAAGLGVLLVTPLVLKGLEQSDAISWIRADGAAVRQLPEAVFLSTAVAVVLVALAVVGSALLARSDRRSLALLVVWAVFPPVFCYLTFSVLHVFLGRYLLSTVPAWALLAGAVAVRGPRARAALVVLVVGVVGLTGQRDVRRDPLPGEPAFLAAARVVDAGLEPGDGIVFPQGGRSARRPFDYQRLHGVLGPFDDVLMGASPQQRGTFRAGPCRDSAACLAGVDRIWLITPSERGADLMPGVAPSARRILGSDFTRELVARLEGVRVYLLVRRAGA